LERGYPNIEIGCYWKNQQNCFGGVVVGDADDVVDVLGGGVVGVSSDGGVDGCVSGLVDGCVDGCVAAGGVGGGVLWVAVKVVDDELVALALVVAAVVFLAAHTNLCPSVVVLDRALAVKIWRGVFVAADHLILVVEV